MVQPKNRQPEVPKAGGPRRVVPVSKAAQPVLQSVVDALDAGAQGEAVRQFLRGVTHRLFPDDLHLVHWVIQAIGKDNAVRLAEAFAVHPCFYCERGVTACENCGGSGRLIDGGICLRCLGLGRSFCDFCNGSGWATINFVPAGLRMEVAIARVGLVLAPIQAMLKAPLPSENADDPTQTSQACAELLVALNQKLGVLDNTLTALKTFVPPELAAPERTDRVVHACVAAAHLVQRHMQKVLDVMASAARRRASKASSAEGRTAAGRAVDLYERLAKSGCAYTQLEHPFIQRIAQEMPPAARDATDRKPPAAPPERKGKG
jgi:hypothetical protein